MTKTRGTGLLMVWTDIDPEFEAEFNRWYDEEHITAASRGTGLSQRRPLCRGEGGAEIPRDVRARGPQRAAQHGLSRHRQIPALAAARQNPGPAGSGAISCATPIGRSSRCTPTRSSRRSRWRLFCRWAASTCPAAIEEEFNAWYNTAYIPGYLAVPGCLGARRFVAVEGQPKYLTVYEFEHARGLGERGLEPRPGQQSVDAAGAAEPAPRRRLARRLPAHLSEISSAGRPVSRYLVPAAAVDKAARGAFADPHHSIVHPTAGTHSPHCRK